MLSSVCESVLGLALLVSPGAPVKETTHLNCYGTSEDRILSIQFDGPRYGDQLSIKDYGSDLVRPLLTDEDRAQNLLDSSFLMFLGVGACKANQSGTGPVLTCDYTDADGPGWAMGHYNFRYFLDKQDFFYEIRRNAKIHALQLNFAPESVHDELMKRDYTALRMNLTMKIETATGLVDYSFSRLMGEWSDTALNRCVFE